MSLCPHGYTAFWDCPICEEPMGTAPSEQHEFGCTAFVGRACICETLRKERSHQPLHGDHTRPVLGCLSCDDAMSEAGAIEAERPWEET